MVLSSLMVEGEASLFEIAISPTGGAIALGNAGEAGFTG
jgi:hypothetical protein